MQSDLLQQLKRAQQEPDLARRTAALRETLTRRKETLSVAFQ